MLSFLPLTIPIFMANGRTELTPLTLPAKTIQTSRTDLYCDIPFHPDGGKFQAIPVEFLRRRAAYSIDRLFERIGVATGKHHEKRIADVSANIDDLRTQIGRIIDDIPSIGITNAVELQDICRKTGRAVIKFKADRERNLDVGQKVSTILLQIERDIIKDLFDLPAPKQPEEPSLTALTGEELIASKEIYNAHSAISAVFGICPRLGEFVTMVTIKREEFKASLDVLADVKKLQHLIDLLQKPETLEQLPEAVKTACIQEFERYRSTLLAVIEFVKNLNEIKALLEIYDHEQLNRLKEAGGYFEALVKYKGIGGLEQRVRDLRLLEPDFENALTLMKNAAEAVIEFDGDEDLITSYSEIKKIADAIAVFVPDAANDELISKIFQVTEPTATVTLDGAKRSGLSQNQPLADAAEDGGYFKWKDATPEKAKAEVRRKILGNSQLTLLAYLLKAERWSDLKRMLEKLNFSDLRKCRISTSAVGDESGVYKDREDLLKKCFPEAYGPDSEPVTTMTRGLSETKFRWVRKGITKEEIRAEIKGRLFAGWPLIKDLAEKKKWAELKQVFDKIAKRDLLECRISRVVIGGPTAPYKTNEEMFQDVFPEAYPNTDGQEI